MIRTPNTGDASRGRTAPRADKSGDSAFDARRRDAAAGLASPGGERLPAGDAADAPRHGRPPGKARVACRKGQVRAATATDRGFGPDVPLWEDDGAPPPHEEWL
ncbi:protein of unknown function [Burkholderia multivorans]